MSLTMALTRTLLRFTPTPTATAETLRAALPHRREPAPVTRAVRRVAWVEREVVNGCPVIRLTPKYPPAPMTPPTPKTARAGKTAPTGKTAPARDTAPTPTTAHTQSAPPRRGTAPSPTHLLYTHGGAYVSPILATHWNLLATLVKISGVTVTVPLYPLAPEHHVDETYALLDVLYDRAVAEAAGARGTTGSAGATGSAGPLGSTAGRVVLGGDSAGGALALGQAQRYRDAAKPPPAGVVLISPWLDATMSNPEISALQPLDHMLGADGLAEAGRWWAGERDPRDALVSPLFGTFDGLPPVFTYQGDRDVLLPDTKLLAQAINAAGGRNELRVYRGAIHDFPGAPWTPEARRALLHMGKVLQGTA